MPFENPVKSSAPSITLSQARVALNNLLTSKFGRTEYWAHRDSHECRIDVHPFGLDTSIPARLESITDIHLVAFPGYTDISVAAMKMMIAHHLPIHGQPSDQLRLRIIRIRLDGREQTQHDLYFELMTTVGTFMCGGCNDYSGTGGAGGHELEGIFTFIATMYDIPLEEVVLTEDEARLGVDSLKRAYNDFECRKQQVA